MKKLFLFVISVLICASFLSGCGDDVTTQEKAIKVTFDLMDGSDNIVADIDSNNKVSFPTKPVRDGYTFEGWFLADTGVLVDENTEFSSSATLKASWIKISAVAGEVYFYPENGCAAVLVKCDGTTMSFPESIPEKTGFSFKGWFSEKNGEGEKLISVSSNEGISSVYASWAEIKKLSTGIELGAFSGVTYNHMPYKDTGIETGYYFTEDDIRIMSEAGIDFMFADFYQTGDFREENHTNMMKWAEQYGIGVYVHDATLLDPTLSVETIKASSSKYDSFKSFAGFYLVDEPGWAVFQNLEDIMVNLHRVYPGITCHVNMIGREAFLTFDEYEDFMDGFLKIAKSIDHLSSDNYEIKYNTITGKRELGSSYFKIVEIGATLSAKYGVDHWQYIDTYNGTETGKVLTKNDIAIQLYSCLAAGTRKILYFCYDGTHYYGPMETSSDGVYALRNSARERTNLYTYCTELAGDIHFLADAYANYKWVRMGTVVGSNEEITMNAVLAETKYLSKYLDTTMMNVVSDKSVLIGEFSEINGSGVGFVLMNAGDLETAPSTEVSFSVPGSVCGTIYLSGEKTDVKPDKDGLYHVSLDCAEAAFMTFEYYEN